MSGLCACPVEPQPFVGSNPASGSASWGIAMMTVEVSAAVAEASADADADVSADAALALDDAALLEHATSPDAPKAAATMAAPVPKTNFLREIG